MPVLESPQPEQNAGLEVELVGVGFVVPEKAYQLWTTG